MRRRRRKKTAKSTEYKGKHLIIDGRSKTNLQYVGEMSMLKLIR
jgi:hypothetical protein